MKEINLNLLNILRVLLELKNTSKAAQQLGLSQPSVSRSLSQLRSHFDDELFIRSHYGLEPTTKALQIGEKLPEILDQLQDLLEGKKSFDIKHYDKKITIAMNAFIANWLAKPLLKKILLEAPNAQLHIVNWDINSPNDLLEGKVDLGINYFPLALSKQLIQKRIGEDGFSVLCRKDHPIKGTTLMPSHFQQYAVASLLIPNWNEQKNYTSELLKAFNIQPNIQFRSHYFPLMLDALNSSDMLMPCSSLLANTLKDKFKVLTIDGSIFPKVSGDFALYFANKNRHHPLQLQLQKWIQQCNLECTKHQ